MIEIKRLGAADIRDANLPNEPFPIRGRLIPALENGAWSWRTELFPGQTEMCFPDCPYDPADESAAFLGAYEHGVCVGLAVLRKAMFRYLYLDDLKVCRAWRGRGVGARLVEACMDTAKEMGLQGVYVVAQDNNLDACLFYLRRGFAIGGFDNRAYRGTPQAHKADVYFYRDCEQQSPS